MSDEFELIDAIVAALGEVATGAGVVVGPGDDAAVLALPPSHPLAQQLVVSTDTLVSGRHFPAQAKADLIGYRSLAVATSDLAAMGAEPAWATISLTAPELSRDWALAFASGIATAARSFGLKIVGGNLARGATNIGVTVHGHVPSGQALTRSNAQRGDDIYVTGTLGGARLALSDIDALADCDLRRLDPQTPAGRYWLPQPRLTLGTQLRTIASAAADISDGLTADLSHICRASRVSCDADLHQLPTAPGCNALDAANAGDDYELVFAAPPTRRQRIVALARDTNIAITRIGTLIDRAPYSVAWRDGNETVAPQQGFRHF